MDYVKDLEAKLMQVWDQQADPEELEAALVELESHKKALKGLTSQYNSLEREHTEHMARCQPPADN